GRDSRRPALGAGVAVRGIPLAPPVEVSFHEVGGAEEVRRAGSDSEPVDARVLEEAADDRPDADPLREARNAWAETAHAAHDEVDLGAGLRRVVQRVDHLGIDEAVELQRDPTVGCRLTTNQLEQARTQPRRRDEQGTELLLSAVAGEEVEDV